MPNVDYLILHGLVVTMDRQGTIVENGGLAVAGSDVLAVGRSEEIEARYGGRALERVEAAGRLVLPGLINLHSHAADALFRGLFDDLPLEPWLEKLWGVESRFVDAETVLVGSRLGFAEMVRGGITTTLDMFWFPDSVVRAAQEVGLRIFCGPIYFDQPDLDGLQGEERRARAREFLEEYRRHPLVTPCVLPHSTYTVSPESLREAQDLANEHDALLSIHASETMAELSTVSQRYGASPPRHLDALGLLHDRTLLAHGVHLPPDEIDLLAERRAAVAHCPLSNLKLGSGIAPLPDLRRAGVRTGLGTDGPASGNDLDLWLAIRLAAVLHKGVRRDPALLPAADVVRMATREAAQALGAGHLIGSLEPGKRADLILVDLHRPHLVPRYDVYSHLVYAVGRGDVETVFVHGRPVLRGRRFQTFDEASTLLDVERLAKRIGGAARA